MHKIFTTISGKTVGLHPRLVHVRLSGSFRDMHNVNTKIRLA